MNKKLFLTSAIALGFIAPAMAEPTNTGEFPSNGLMQADYTYTNAATESNMDGVYEGSVNAEAEYTNIDYSVAAGLYLTGLNANNEATTATCTAGNFCPGVQSTTYTNNAFGSTGLQACPNGYSSSAAGASANTECFRACSTSDVAHSTGTVNGGVYYDGTSGDGVNACSPTACVHGWHIKPGLNVANTIGNTDGINSAYISNSGSFSDQDFGGGSHNAAYYGLSTSDHNSFAVNYGNAGMIHGHGRCSTTPGTFDFNWSTEQLNAPITIFASLTDETGQEGAQYCYCNVDGYTPAGGTLQSLSSAWVFNNGGGGGDASSCASDCARDCAGSLRGTSSSVLAFRGALLGSVGASPATCEVNTITINWTGTTETEINANNAGTATYGSDVRTPRSATPVPGKTFTGWRFSAPQQASVQEP